MRAVGWLRGLALPDVPEPIAESSWRRIARVKLVVFPALALLNVLAIPLSAYSPVPIDPAVLRRFVAVNLAGHAVVVGLAAWLLWRPRSERAWRSATYVSIVAETWTAVTALWVMGCVTSWNYLWMPILIGFYRLYCDARLGAFAYAVAIALHAGLVALVCAGVLSGAPLSSVNAPAIYAHPSSILYAAGWIFVIYTVAWLVMSHVAVRVRTTEHALRELNGGLERRVAEQVELLVRAGRLRRYLAPQVVERILASEEDPSALRERRPVTVMFCDLKGFTQMVERTDPETLANVLARYFDEVADIAFRHGGTIDKFIGDAVMVFFGAPEQTGEADQARRCVAMALEIQRRIAELADDFIARGAGGPLTLRIGIGSGTAVVGSFGARHRADFTAVGAPVNRAARVEPLAPPGGVLIDQETHDLVAGAFALSAHGEVTLKGFARPVQLFRVDGPPADALGATSAGC